MSEPDFFKGKKVVGILGYGRFGRFLAERLCDIADGNFEVVVFSRKTVHEPNKTIHFLPVEKMGMADVLFPCIPISHFEEIMTEIADQIKPNSLVIDVCSVKVFPIEVMKKVLPESVEIIGSHPVFGPDSFRKNGGLANLPIVLTKVRCSEETYAKVKAICDKQMLRILEMTAEQHDQYAAYSQAYAFLVGKISQRMNIQPTPIDTMWYKLLMEERDAIQNDSEQLFFDIQTKNPFTPAMRQKFQQAVDYVFDEIVKETKGTV